MEPILASQPSGFVLFRIEYPDLWRVYKAASAAFWTAADIDNLGADVCHWKTALNADERAVLSTILAISASSHRDVFGALASRLCAEVQVVEARSFYRFQAVMQNIHSNSCGMLLQALMGHASDQCRLVSSVETMPTVKAKADWCSQWFANEDQSSFGTRLVAVAVMEGVFLSSSFAVMFWLRNRRLMPALTKTYELIARDAGLRTWFAFLLYRHLRVRPSSYVVRRMVEDAVWLEVSFAEAVIPRTLQGMNASLVRDYVQYVGDYVLENFGLARWFRVENPFECSFQTAVVAAGPRPRRPLGPLGQ